VSRVFCLKKCWYSNWTTKKCYSWYQGRNQLFISGGATFMKFHSMTSSCSFNRGTTFSQTVTYNNVFLPAHTKSIVQTYTFCTTLVNKNSQNRTFYNSVGGWITGVKRNFWYHAICHAQSNILHIKYAEKTDD